jgi:hypothetical protein
MKRTMPALLVLVLLTSALASAQTLAPLQLEIDALNDRVNFVTLRQAIADLSTRFPERYPDGAKFLERLAQLSAQLPDRPALLRDVQALQREALLANPLLNGQPILFVVRPQYKSDHHNTATLFQTGEINTASFRGGGALKIIDFAQNGKVETLLSVDDGIIRDPEVHFEGQRIVFSMRENIDDDYHIYELNTDGSELRQRTGARGVSDIDPLYLPGGDIVFSSTREPKYCMCNRHIMANLYRMNGDGANIHQIGKSTLFEGHGTLTPEGRILYYRWEYVDRNFGDAQALWTVNPDGTNHAVYWGNNTNSPGGVIDARPIPGTQQVLCIFGSCHDRPWGALAIVDRRLGMDGKGPVIRTWPSDAIDLVGVGNFDTFKRVSPKYEDPYPLDDTYFLCSRMTGSGEQMGLYLVDIFGNEIQLHAEESGCFDPMPIRPRRRPPTLPERRDYHNEAGYFFVTDVYQGTHMKGVERGSIKHLRVVESPEKRFWTTSRWNGQGTAAPAMNWHDFNNKRILGTVPVHEDGSAYFAVPSDTFVYFQLLDESGMMVQSMRSGTIVQSGEVVGCVGCHDSRQSAPGYHSEGVTPLALQKEPATLRGWYGEPRLFNYLAEVQPAFDRHCVDCHDYGNAEGGLNLGRDRTLTFNTSYNELWRKGLISVPGAGPAPIQEARAWGSHASELIKIIRGGHYDVEMGSDAVDRIVTWIDINAPYYPRYDSAYPGNLAGRAPLNLVQLKRLGQLTGVPFEKLADYRTNQGPQVSFDRPALSPCLQGMKKDSSEHEEALALIEAGKAKLASRPRADMTAFEASPIDQSRETSYNERRAIEYANRTAIRSNLKKYDAGLNAGSVLNAD